MARISDNSIFKVRLVGDVFRNGPDRYQLVGTVGIADYRSPIDVVVGECNGEEFSINSEFFSFVVNCRNPDSLLQPGPTDFWVFEGDPLVTPDTINGKFGGEDGVDGSITLFAGRREYLTGSLTGITVNSSGSQTLDDFFNANRASNGFDISLMIGPITD